MSFFDDIQMMWMLFADPIITSVFAWSALGSLGAYLLAKQFVFLSVAVSQMASLGVTLSLWLIPILGVGLLTSPSVWAMFLSLSALALFWRNNAYIDGLNGQSNQGDQQLGLMYLIGIVGTVLLSSHLTHEAADPKTLLFGSAVAVTVEGKNEVITVSLIALMMNLWLWRGWLAVTLDPIGAKLRQLPGAFLDYSLMAIIAVLIAICTKTLGALPIFSASILPTLSMRIWVKSPQLLMLSSAVIGMLAASFGYLLAYMTDHPVGASQAGVAILIYLMSLVVKAVATR